MPFLDRILELLAMPGREQTGVQINLCADGK